MTMVTLPLTVANGAPVGTPVSVTRTITMQGSGVSGLHHKDGVIWASLYNSSQVERFNASTGSVIGSPITVGANPVSGIEVDGKLYIPAAGSNTVSVIDMATATVVRTVTLPGSNIATLNYDGINIWALSFNDAHVQRFNPSTGALVGSTIPVGSQPGMALMANGRLYVSASGSNTVTDINMSTATVAHTISLNGSNISALHHDGTTLWASVFNNAQVARINPSNGTVLGYTNVGQQPTNIISANGSVWVGSTGSDLVTQINPSTGAVIRNISQGGSNISSLNYDGEVIWATNFHGNFVSMINTTTGAVSNTKPATGTLPVVTLIIDNKVWVGPAGSGAITQISGPTPATTTTTTTTVAPSTTTTAPSTTTTAPVATSAPVPTTIASATSPTGATPTVENNDSSVDELDSPRNVVTRGITTPSSSTTSTSTTTTSVPDIADVISGSAAVLVNGLESEATVARSNNQLVVSASGIEMKIWAVKEDGSIVNLDADGNLRVISSDEIEMAVSGLRATANVEMWMFSTPTKLGTVVADGSGKATGRFQIPEDTPDGDHRLALESLLPNNEKAVLAVGIVTGEVNSTSTTTQVLIAIPMLLAIAAGLIVPTTVRRRRQRIRNA